MERAYLNKDCAQNERLGSAGAKLACPYQTANQIGGKIKQQQYCKSQIGNKINSKHIAKAIQEAKSTANILQNPNRRQNQQQPH